MEAVYKSKYWSVKEWDCLQRTDIEWTWDGVTSHAWEEDGLLCTDNEKTGNLFKILDLLREWRINAKLPLENNWQINWTNEGYKSGYRTPEVNASVGGEWNSYHIRGCAADICIAGQDDTDANLAQTVLDAAKAYGLEKQLGIGYYGDWIHVDTRGYNSRW